jgi:hypothetical protein
MPVNEMEVAVLYYRLRPTSQGVSPRCFDAAAKFADLMDYELDHDPDLDRGDLEYQANNKEVASAVDVFWAINRGHFTDLASGGFYSISMPDVEVKL